MQATSTDRWVACAARSVAGSERARARRRVKDMRAPRVSKATPIARQLLTPVRAWLALHVFGEGVFVVVAIVAGSHVRRAGTCASARRRCCSPPTSPRLPEGMRRTRRYGGSLIAAARGQRQRRARMPAAVCARACERGDKLPLLVRASTSASGVSRGESVSHAYLAFVMFTPDCGVCAGESYG